MPPEVPPVGSDPSGTPPEPSVPAVPPAPGADVLAPPEVSPSPSPPEFPLPGAAPPTPWHPITKAATQPKIAEEIVDVLRNLTVLDVPKGRLRSKNEH